MGAPLLDLVLRGARVPSPPGPWAPQGRGLDEPLELGLMPAGAVVGLA